MRSTVFLLLGVASGMPRAARAQTQLEFAPYLGLYWPTSILASGGGETLKQQRSVTLGMRVTKWWPGRLASKEPWAMPQALFGAANMGSPSPPTCSPSAPRHSYA